MARKLASIQKITELKPIEGADKIELATVLGWHVVTAKENDFKIGDLICYFEVDSLLPLKPEYEFLGRGSSPKKTLVDGKEMQGYRLKTIKLRGQISQGLIMPLSIFEPAERIVLKEGDDVTEVLGVYKYEMPMPAELAGKARGNFPGFLPKTDEPRLQAYPQILEKYKHQSFYVTEKIDGSSCTFVIKHDEFHVCSRNVDLLEVSENSLWKLAREMKIEEKLREANKVKKMETWALQGEIYGEGIQANPLKIKGQKIAFFNLYNFVKGEFAVYDDFVIKVAHEMKLPIVPILADPDECVVWRLRDTVDKMIELTRLKSKINTDAWIEGMVWRPIDEEVQDPDIGRLSFKIINPEYLLKHEQ